MEKKVGVVKQYLGKVEELEAQVEQMGEQLVALQNNQLVSNINLSALIEMLVAGIPLEGNKEGLEKRIFAIGKAVEKEWEESRKSAN